MSQYFLRAVLLVLLNFWFVGELSADVCRDIFPAGKNSGSTAGLTPIAFGGPTYSRGNNAGLSLAGGQEHAYTALSVANGFNLSVTGSGTARLHIAGSASIGNNARINVGGNPEDLVIYVGGSLAIGSGAQINALIYAAGNITISNNGFTVGSVTAAASTVTGNNHTITYDSTAIDDADFSGMCDAFSPVLVAEYRFDELVWDGSPGEVLDFSGNDNHGRALQAGVGVETIDDGFLCRAGSFPDVNNQTSHAVDTGLDVDADIGNKGAISIWHRSNTDWATTGVSKNLWDASSNTIYFYLLLHSDGRLEFGFEDQRDSDYRIVTQNVQAINADDWANVVVNWDVANNAAPGEIWVNGVKQAVTVRNDTIVHSRDLGNTFTLYIGDNRSSYNPNSRSNSGADRSVDGEIDEVLVYDGVLSGAEISNIISLQSNGQNLDGSVRACPFTPVAQYRFEEPSWNGVSGEVTNLQGNGLNGRAINGATTAVASPDAAIDGSPGTCRYGDFLGGSEFVQIEDNPLLDLNTEFTVAAWIYPREFPRSGLHTIVSKDENFEFHITRNNQINWWWQDSNRRTRQITTRGTALTTNRWYHVAIVYRSGEQNIYIDGVERGSATHAGQLRVNNDPLLIATDLNFVPARNFNGAIDEVNIFDVALTQAEVNVIRQQAFPCSVAPAIHHFEITHNNSAVFCAPTPVTVAAKNAAGDTVTGYTGTVTIDTNSGVGDWSTSTGGGTLANGTVNDGEALYSFTSADNGEVTFILDHSDLSTTTPLAINISADDGGVVDDDSEGLLTFSATAFAITGSALANPPPAAVADFPVINTQVAGVEFPIHIALYGEDSSAVCGVLKTYNGNKNLTYNVNYKNPNSGTIGLVNSSPVNFFEGRGTVAVNYRDVGEISIDVSDGSYSGESGNFVVVPHAFGIVLGPVGSSEDVDTNATDAASAIYKKSGESFTVRVSSLEAGGNVTPNYGLEAIAEEILLAHQLQAPTAVDGGVAGLFTASAGLPNAGTFTFDAAWNEVGIIQLNASVADGDYLGTGYNVTSSRANVGRFYPAFFTVSNAALANRNQLAGATQAACVSDFTFLGEDLTLTFSVTANRIGGGVTTNYENDFAKLEVPSVGVDIDIGDASGDDRNSWNIIARHASGDYTGADRLVGAATSPDFIDGTVTSHAVIVRFDRAGGVTPSPEAPFLNTDFLLRPKDSDGVETQTAAHVDVGRTQLYFGRLATESAYGPEDRPLPIWVHTEYCMAVNASGCVAWQDLSRAAPVRDSCTIMALQDPVVAESTEVGFGGCWQGGVSYSDPLVTPLCAAQAQTFDSLQNRGGTGWLLNYIGGGNGGTYITPSLGSKTVNDFHPYLILQQGSVNFGSYRGNDRIIYWRER